jgi:hypothetical protein
VNNHGPRRKAGAFLETTKMTDKHFHLSSVPVPEGPRRFETHRVIVLPRALDELREEEIAEAVERHFRCDWGDPGLLTAEDVADMDAKFLAGEQVTSVFEARRPGPCPLNVITNAERTETTVAMEWDDSPTQQELTRRFLGDLEALLKRHGLTLQLNAKGGDLYSPDGWFFEGRGLEYALPIWQVADWVDAAEPVDE